ncbi:CDP-archaeol synthase [Fundicoccus culcitae]|uniref:CDP-archaeol synthase n=1 Tax=Fundicoccus culcitae TaxID=2969821 RepID=A0ABY5P7E0_9LACT|nr:CDP-archaeol synthase [Fundicoccus culcitae]UUX34652.1 CDP-archaeol synthase [Fundicoccus culcitae]
MSIVLKMYATLMPVIFAGVANMLFCKSNVLAQWAVPMDRGKRLWDGNRLFGDNKTWKGFLGMIVFGIIFQLLWSIPFLLIPQMNQYHYIYADYPNQLTLNIGFGFQLGLAYVLFELPNSFIKRRLNILPGKTSTNKILKVIFIWVDQADSIIGCTWVISLYVHLSGLEWAGFIVLGSLTHILINGLLYQLKWRRNRF